MRNIFLIFLLFMSFGYALSQDRIVRTNGQIIECKITSVDSIRIYLIHTTGEISTNTNIDLSEVRYYKVDGAITEVSEEKSDLLNKSKTGKADLPNPLKIYADSIEDLNRNLVYYFNENIIFGNSVEYSKLPFDVARVYVDSKDLKCSDIKFYKNETGFYANTKNFNFWKLNRFSPRILDGKINLYQSMIWKYLPGGIYPNGVMVGSSRYKVIRTYYNVGFGDLKRATYANLSPVLSIDSESLKHLKKYQNSNTAQILLILGGAAAMVASVLSIDAKSDIQTNPSSPTPDNTIEVIGILGGFGCFGLSYYISINKSKHLRHAVFEFNN